MHSRGYGLFVHKGPPSTLSIALGPDWSRKEPWRARRCLGNLSLIGRARPFRISSESFSRELLAESTRWAAGYLPARCSEGSWERTRTQSARPTGLAPDRDTRWRGLVTARSWRSNRPRPGTTTRPLESGNSWEVRCSRPACRAFLRTNSRPWRSRPFAFTSGARTCESVMSTATAETLTSWAASWRSPFRLQSKG